MTVFTNTLKHGTGSRSYTRDTPPSTALPTDPARFTPEQFGAIGDGQNHFARNTLNVGTLAELQAMSGGIYWFATSLDDQMDWLGCQAALYAGGVIQGRPGAWYLLNRTLHVRNGTIHTADWSGARLDFTQLVAAPDSGQNLIQNGTFATADHWENTTLTPRTDWVIGGGSATWTDPPIGGGSHFGQMGQRNIPIPEGRWSVSLTIEQSEGASEGYYGGRQMNIGFWADQIGMAGSPDIPKYLIHAREGTWTVGFSFEIFDAGVTATFGWNAYNADFVVTNVVLTQYYLNTAVWCDGAVTSTTAYNVTIWRGGEIVGPGIASGVRGFLHQTLGAGDVRCHVDDANITGFEGGHVFADNAYLNRINGGSTGYCNPCIKFIAGSTNAGENIRISDHTCYNSGLILDLAGGEFFFFGCSFDYSDKLCELDREAFVRFHGCHIEMRHPPTTLVLSAITGNFTVGATLTGGTSGATGTVLEHPTWGETAGTLVLSVDSGTFQAGEIVTDSRGGSATAAGTVDEADVVFDLAGSSTLMFETGELLMAGFMHRGNQHLVRTADTFCTLGLPDGIYNVQTASGRLMTGPGVVRLCGRGHVWPGNALIGWMWSDNFLMDRFGGAGRIVGPSTASDMSFPAPDDGIGLLCGLYCDGAPASRIDTPGEVTITVDAGYGRDVDHGSLKVEHAAGYGGRASWQVFVPVQEGRLAMTEYWWAKPDAVAEIPHGPFANGVPGVGDTIRVNTVIDSTLVEIDDKHCQGLGSFGPQTGWTVTITGTAGDPGGIPNATIDGTHTIVERTGTTTFTIDVGTAATSTAAAAGGTAMGTSFSQTNVLVFNQIFWVAVIGTDGVGRPIIGQEAYQGEDHILLPCAATEWTAKKMVSYYTAGVIPDDPRLRTGRGRAPAWATHLVMVLDFGWVRDLGGGTPPPFYLTDYLANVI